MLSQLRSVARPLQKLLAFPLVKAGVPPHLVTLAGVPLAMGAAAMTQWEAPRAALILALGACLTDFLDGAVARESKRVTPFGDLLDAVVDRWVEIILLLGFALKFPLLAGLCAGLSLSISYIKARTGLVVDCDNSDWPGWACRSDRLLLVLMAIARPDWSFWLLAALLGLCTLGCLQRLNHAHRLIGERSR